MTYRIKLKNLFSNGRGYARTYYGLWFALCGRLVHTAHPGAVLDDLRP